MLKNGLIMHLIVTLVWFLLMRGGIPTLVIGWFLGWLLLYLLREVLEISDYVRRLNGFVVFLYVLGRELVLANLRLAMVIMFRPRSEMHPDFIQLDVSDLSDGELYLLAQCITLTPGTTAVDIQDGSLLIHAFDGSDHERVRHEINSTLRCAITRFTR